MSRPISPPGIHAEHEHEPEPEPETQTEKICDSGSPRRSTDGNSSDDGLKMETKQYDEDGTFAPIACPATHEERGTLQKMRSNASRSMERSWSLNDGVSIGGEEFGEENAEVGEDNGFVVGWEEGDVLYPRNMNKGRKWLIVIIVSMGSLCV